jgi:methanogenic corrinoid protein MtbC1
MTGATDGPDATRDVAGPRDGAGTGAGDEVTGFLRRTEAGAASEALALVAARLRADGPVPVVTQLLGPAQLEVGRRWHAGSYTVAQEHLASAVVEDALGVVAASFPPPSDTANTLALVCAEGEWHTTPARMAAVLARADGWRVQFLGASTPADHLRTTLASLSPQVLAVSCTLPLALPGVATLAEVAAELGIPVLAGGIAFDAEGRRAAAVGAAATRRSMVAGLPLLERWLDAPPAPTTPAPLPVHLAEQRATLALDRERLIDETYTLLAQRLPQLATYDDRRREHTRRDLDYIVRFADVALMTGDDTVFHEFIGWLRPLLVSRGVPEHVLSVTLEAAAATAGPMLPTYRHLLDAAAAA